MTIPPDYSELLSSQIPALHVLMALGYTYLTPAEALDLRGGRRDAVILTDVLTNWLHQHNHYTYQGQAYAFTDSALRDALRKLTDIPLQGLVPTSAQVYELLTLGTSLPQTIKGDTRSFSLHYIDWQHPANNVYHVTEEYSVERRGSHETRRPDVVCFVNGIPFAVIECKRPDLQTAQGGLPYEEAVSQMLRNQGEQEIPHLFIYAQLLLALSVNHARYAATGANKDYWATWQEQPDPDAHEVRVQRLINTPRDSATQARLYDWRDHADYLRFQAERGPRLPTLQDQTLVSLLEPSRLLELTYQYIVYDGGVKKIARYQQYYAVKATVDRVAHLNPQGERTGGIIWHTTGSGKSLTMVMLAKALALHPNITNPRVILVTDRINLDQQISKTFLACGKQVVRANSGQHLLELVQSAGADIIATVINKFATVAREKGSDPNPNVFVLVDEGHRGQYGEIHAQMRQVFTHGCYIGFTGTPLTQREKNTARQFGSFIHKYSMRQAVSDKAVVPLLYEGRMVEMQVNHEQVDRWFERVTRDLSEDQRADLKRKMSRAEEVSNVEQRIAEIAYDLSQHFVKTFQGQGFKAQLATSSKAMALKYKHYLDAFGMVTSAVVISAPDSREGHDEVDDPDEDAVQAFWKRTMQRHTTEDRYNTAVIDDFAREDGVELLIVVDKLLVGFDEPRNTVLYIDKPLKDHAILQAIARVNRLYPGKEFGYIIDYRGVLGELNEAIQTYDALADFDDEDVAGTITDVTAEIGRLADLYEALWAVFRGVDSHDNEAMERHLEPEDIRQQFYDALNAYASTLKVALSTVAFAETTPAARIDQYKRDLRYFHNLRMVVKLRYAEAIDYRDYEQKVRKLLDQHISAHGVTPITDAVDIFDREAFDATVSRLGTNRARAEAILNRLKRTVIEKLEQDPAFYKKFSHLIDDTLQDLREGRLTDLEALELARSLRDQVAEGHDQSLPPILRNYKHAPAFYGVLHEVWGANGFNTDDLADLAIQVEILIEQLKITDWRANVDVQHDMENAIEDCLYDAGDERGIRLESLDLDTVIPQLIDIARKRND